MNNAAVVLIIVGILALLMLPLCFPEYMVLHYSLMPPIE